MKPSHYNYIKRSLVRASFGIHIDIKKVLLFPFKLIWWGIKYSFLFVYWILKIMFLAEVYLLLGCLYIICHSVQLICKLFFHIDLQLGGKIYFALKRFANYLLDLFHLKDSGFPTSPLSDHTDLELEDSTMLSSSPSLEATERQLRSEQLSHKTKTDEIILYAAMCERYAQEQEYLEKFGIESEDM